MDETAAEKQDNHPVEDETNNDECLENIPLNQQKEDGKSNTEVLDIPEKNEGTPLEETTDIQHEKEKQISDQDIILRSSEPKETKPKWNQKCTVITLLSSDARDENAYVGSGKNPTETKPKKIPKVLSKLCLGPASDDSAIGTISEKPRQDEAEESEACDDEADAKEKKTVYKNGTSKTKTVITMFKNRSDNLECSDQHSGDSETDVNDNKTENTVKKLNDKNMDLKTSITPKMLRRMFSRKRSSSVESADERHEKLKDISLTDNTAATPPVILDSEWEDEDVELRKKPQSLKHTITVGFRNSFRLKRTLSEPSNKKRRYDLTPQRSNTLRIFSKALFQFQVSELQPPAPLLVEDPPSSEDGSDLEDVRQLTDPALLNGSSGNFGSAGTRSAPSTPQGVQCASPGGLAEPLSQPCSPGCTSPSIQRSPSHSVFTKCEKASLKHLSTSTPVMTAQAQLAEPPSPKATKDPKVHTTSKARQKKFLRHFPNVEDDEKVLNHYSCALIGDILLQGHLYITKNYFAFYSNVFGYVTKLLIPVLTVENITKEKTARIIPNAVGISTSEDKHVFGSLMSRDNTLQYMRTVWQKAKSASPVIIEPEITEQDLDSSESGEGESGRDSPPIEIKPRFSLVKKVGVGKEQLLPNASEALSYEKNYSKSLMKPLKQAISEFRKLPRQSLILFATTLLLILLFLSAAVLLYRISKIQNRYSLVLQDNVVSAGSEDIYSDLLNWQTQLHSKSAGAVHSFLDTNLDQIAKVRKSLETLSSLLVQNSGSTGKEANTKPLETTKDTS
uniref:GRAM domain-containing protein 1B n=1 Tax=Anoplophora glabripennis TaxID=217634 RepID=V5GJ95_ANOGL